MKYIYKKIQKAMIERIYWIVSTYWNVKRVYHGISEGHGQSQKIIGCTQLFFLWLSFALDIWNAYHAVKYVVGSW